MLQAAALLVDIRDDTIGEIATSIASFNQPIEIGSLDVRKITILAVIVTALALALLAALLTRTTIGTCAPRRRTSARHACWEST